MAEATIETSAPATEQAPPAPETEPTQSAEAKPNGKANGKAKPAEPPPEAHPVDEAELLRTLAAKLGFEVEDRKLTTKERAEFRLKAKELRSEIDAELQQRREAFEAEVNPRRAQLDKAMALEAAHEAGDYEAIARILGNKDWDELQKTVIEKLSNPHYKEVQELKRWKEETAERERRAAAEWEQQQVAQRHAQAVAAHKADLSERMSRSNDPLIRAMHDDPGFIQAVFRIQQENWDGTETVSPEQAIRMAAKGTSRALRDEMVELKKRLDQAFPVQAAEPAEEKSLMKAPAPKTSPAPKPAAAATKKWDFTDPKTEMEFRKRRDALLAEASAREVLESTKQ